MTATVLSQMEYYWIYLFSIKFIIFVILRYLIKSEIYLSFLKFNVCDGILFINIDFLTIVKLGQLSSKCSIVTQSKLQNVQFNEIDLSI